MHQLAVVLHQLGHLVKVSYADHFSNAFIQKDFFLSKNLCFSLQEIQSSNFLDQDYTVITPYPEKNYQQTCYFLQDKKYRCLSYHQYLQNFFKNKQRIIFIGQEQQVMFSLARHVLEYHQQRSDYLIDHPDFFSVLTLSDAPLVLIQIKDITINQKLIYTHHIGVISALPATQAVCLAQFVQASPKGGILIYDKADACVSALASKPPREDIASLPYHKVYAAGVKILFKHLGITAEAFEEALLSFTNQPSTL